MADKNNNEITAKSLLGRLRGTTEPEKVEKVEVTASESSALDEFFTKTEQDQDDALVAPDFGIFNEMQEELAGSYSNENEITEDDLLEQLDESPALDEDIISEELVEELVEYAEPEEYAEEYAESEEYADEYAEAFDDLVEPELDYSGEDYAAYDEEPIQELMPTIDRMDVLEVAETSDDFDNDPLETEVIFEDVEEIVEEEGEYDEAVDFEHLVSEVVGEETEELSESDISLMVALGMEDELAKSIGEEDAVQLTDDFLADQEEWVVKAAEYGPDEYTDMSQNRKIALEYTKKNKWGLIRLIAAIALTVIIFFYENMPVFGYQVSGVFDPKYYPVIYVMGGLQLLFFLIAAAFPSVVDGAKKLFSLKLMPSSIAFVSAVAATVNTIHICFGIVAGTEPKLFNLPAAICLLMVVADEFFTNRREIFSFNIVSSRNPKYVMRRLNTKDSHLENEAVADLSDESAGDIVKIAKTDFVEGYFWRTNNRGTVDKPFVGLLLILSVVLSLIIGIYVLLTDRVGSAVETAFVSLLTMLPISAIVIGFHPFYRANREAYYNDCTIIGEGSVEEYSDTEVISFDDVNVFPSVNVKVRNVRLYNNCRIDKVLYYAASVFSATGGPLADVFEVATIEMGHSEDVQVVDTGAGFIEAVVNGKNVLFAKEEALLSRGIAIPENVLVADEDEFTPDTSVMYMIYQGRLVSKMTLSYVVDADFEYILRQLSDSGMYVCVKTFDPNIDETLINRQVAESNYPLRVIKYKGTEEITKYSERTDGGIVSRGTTKALLQTISYCDRIVGAKKTGYVLSVISAIISVLLICVAVVTGKWGEIYSIVPAINQLVWLIPVIISTKIIVK